MADILSYCFACCFSSLKQTCSKKANGNVEQNEVRQSGQKQEENKTQKTVTNIEIPGYSRQKGKVEKYWEYE